MFRKERRKEFKTDTLPCLETESSGEKEKEGRKGLKDVKLSAEKNLLKVLEKKDC